MAGALKEKQLAQNVYTALQAVSCPLVEGLCLQDADSMQQLLCTPSQHRTDILAWICTIINPNLKMSSLKYKDPDVLAKEMAAFGQELTLCKADDLDLIRGNACPWQQLQFQEQLLTLVPGPARPTEGDVDGEVLLRDLYSAETLPHLTHMLKPALDPWPADMKASRKGLKSSSYILSKEETADVVTLVQSTQTALEQLQSECEFLQSDAQSSGVLSPCVLRMAVCDLCQLMGAFSHVYETDLKAYCNRSPPSLSREMDTFHRVHQLLQACKTELEMLKEVSEASQSMTERVSDLKTKPLYWNRGEKCTLPEQLDELTRRYSDFLSLLHA